MSIASPIDVLSPATRRRQELAQSIQAQYAKNKGGQKQAQAINAAALHAMPLFAGAGARDSLTLPSAPAPQLTVPFMQNPGTMKNLGVVNPADPSAPTVSQGLGQGAPGFGNPAMPQGDPSQGLGVTQSADPGAPQQQPQAGQGVYADGSPAAQPIMDPNQVLRNFSALAGVRRLYGPPTQDGSNPQMGSNARYFLN